MYVEGKPLPRLECTFDAGTYDRTPVTWTVSSCERVSPCPIACALWVQKQGPPGENWGCCHFSPRPRGGREKPGQGEEAVVPRQRWLL